MENALGSEQMSVLLCDARGDAIRRQHYIRTLLARQVDGFIVVGDSNDLRPSLTRDIPVPVVYVYGESDAPGDLSVLADDANGARLATEHLASLGRRRIAHVTGPQRHTGLPGTAYRACSRSSTPPGCRWPGASRVTASGPNAGGRHAARMLLAAHPDIDAIFCGNDQIATGVADTVRGLGRQIPDDISIVGYDNWHEFAADCLPPLTTVDLNLRQLGETAVKYLFAALDGQPASGVVRQPCRLVVRESTGPVPGDLEPRRHPQLRHPAPLGVQLPAPSGEPIS